ncbi:MAG: CAP domain-containing protein [Chloroflexota bacterium]|nr:CAP domain-containing protein [Chloroflexota bacterium]
MMARSAMPLRVALLVTVVVGGLGATWLAAPGGAGAISASGYKPDAQECQFLAIINRYRASKNKGKLALSATLGAAAEHHSRDMARKKKLYHSDLSKNLRAHDYDGGYAGENVAVGYAKAKAVFEAWRESADHDRNMRDGGFKAIGIGRAKGGEWYWTTTFGNGADQSIRC